MNIEAVESWLDKAAYGEEANAALTADLQRLDADRAAAELLAEAGWDAGFEAGVQAQKHGLGEA